MEQVRKYLTSDRKLSVLDIAVAILLGLILYRLVDYFVLSKLLNAIDLII